VLVLIAIVINAFTYSKYVQEVRAVKKPLTVDPRTSPTKLPMPAKGVTLSVASGIVAGFVPVLLDMSRVGQDGLGAYTAGLLVALSMLGSTLVFAPFFFTFSVHGAPAQFRSYFKGGIAPHVYGILGGILWSIGLITAFASGGPLARIQAGPVATRGFADGAAVLATLWGLLAWREFEGGSQRVRILLTAMLILWILGAGLVAVAPGLGK
jgi:glucose uptake protein